MKIKITNYTNKKIILKENIINEDANITLGKTETYEIDAVHNVHVNAEKLYIKIYYKARYERNEYSYIYIPNDGLIDVTIER